jgi:hypothetical protein
MNREHIRNLLASAVDAKLAYWEANSALEYALAGDNISDRDADAIHDFIEMAGAGIDNGSYVTVEDADDLINQLEDLPTTT